MDTVLDRVCPSCGNTCMPDGRFCLFCGDLLPESDLRALAWPGTTATMTDSPTAAPVPPEFAGFWLRFWAAVIDMVLECVTALLLTVALHYGLRWFGARHGVTPATSAFFSGMAFILILAVGAWLYAALMESSAWGATIGKRLLGLRVVTSFGKQLSFGQATIRHVMKFLSLFTATVGFMMAGWTKRRQALHDLPLDCLVIRVPRVSISLFRR